MYENASYTSQFAHPNVSGKNTKNNQQIVEIKISQEPGRRKTGTKLIYL